MYLWIKSKKNVFESNLAKWSPDVIHAAGIWDRTHLGPTKASHSWGVYAGVSCHVVLHTQMENDTRASQGTVEKLASGIAGNS